MKAMIFAAGLGSRLKPLTDTMPKALVPVDGVPLLEILIRKMIAAGITEIIINVHHFAEQIIAFVESNNYFGIIIRFSDEKGMLLETGGAIKKAVNLLSCDRTADVPFLVHNVDILSNLNLYHFMKSGMPHAATLLVSERVTQRYLLFNDENRLMGWTNIETGQVKSPYKHLNINDFRKYAFAGIHLFSPRLFSYFEHWGERFSVIDFYLSLCEKEPIYGCPLPDLRLMDVGKPDALQQAKDFLKNECC